MKSVSLLFCGILAATATASHGPGRPAASKVAVLWVPRGSSTDVSRKVAPKEWEGAQSLQIAVRHDWKVRVRLKHDDENLYFLFHGVRHGGQRLFPEIFIDPRNLKSGGWEKGQWWFHVSYNLCEGDGEPNVYSKAGVFQCAHRKSGWDANNPPELDTQDIEIRISFLKLKMTPASGLHFGLALAVTDATGDAHQKWYFWPPLAKFDSPKTWGDAALQN